MNVIQSSFSTGERGDPDKNTVLVNSSTS